MDWNECCDFVRDNGITGSEGSIFWQRKSVFSEQVEYYQPEAIKWMKLFFEAHPFIEQIMIVFDD